MGRTRGHDKTNSGGDSTKETKTIVHINNNGRIVIPKGVRRILDVEGTQAKITVYHDNGSVEGIIDVDRDGRATIPIQMRRFIGIDGDELDLRISLSRINSNSGSPE